MVILVIVTVQQPGARDGIQFYLGKFEASELANLEVWATALGQILFSLSPGFGTAITYSSFVDKKEDVYRGALIVAVCNSAFSLVSLQISKLLKSTHSNSLKIVWGLCSVQYRGFYGESRRYDLKHLNEN